MFTFFQAVVTGSPLGRIYATTNKPYYVRAQQQPAAALAMRSALLRCCIALRCTNITFCSDDQHA